MGFNIVRLHSQNVKMNMNRHTRRGSKQCVDDREEISRRWFSDTRNQEEILMVNDAGHEKYFISGVIR
jgi:hypothetical protein